MKKVFFYQFTTSEKRDARLSSSEYLAGQKAWESWQVRQRVLIVCQSKEQAERMDEYLWQFDTERFLPHNLSGEGPRGGAPVEICWPGCRGSGIRHVLINLQEELADFAIMFNDIIDFVPFNEKGKKAARIRYLGYKNLGFQLKTLQTEPQK